MNLEARLHEILTARFGTDWRHELSFNVRADSLSWILKMACWGIESHILKTDTNDFMAKLNANELHRMLCQFITETLVTAPIVNIVKPKRKKK